MKSFISLALLGLAAAGPLQKRERHTEVVVVTEWTTTTVYLSPASPAAFAEHASGAAKVSAEPSAAPPAPSNPPPPPAETPPPAAPAAAAPVAAAAAAPASSGGNVIKSGSGQGTYYDVTVGLGSCGLKMANANSPVVALGWGTMQNGANPNANPLCGKTILITYGGVTHRGMVYDSCEACANGDVDFSTGFFKTVLPNGDGRVNGVSWEIIDEAFPW